MSLHNFLPGGGFGQDDQHRPFMAFGLGDQSPTDLQQSYGKWNIESFTLSDLKASLQLRETKTATEAVLPRNEFDADTYPNMDTELLGTSIPIGFGSVRGAKAYPIDPLTSRFKFLDHSVTTVDGFIDGDGNTFTPNTINLTLSEFTYLAWDGETDLFVDYTADLPNPVDLTREVLIGEVRGAGISETLLDTISAGQGFGPYGARLRYVRGTIPRTGAEVPLYSLGLHIDEPTKIKDILNKIMENTFSFIYIDFDGKWQFRPWRPVPSEGLDVITENMIVGEIKPEATVSGAATKVIAKYAQNLRTESFQRVVHSDDELRQLRGLSAHTVIEKELIISDRFGARDNAQKTVAMRGRPRRPIKFKATSELKLVQPGDYMRLTYAPQDIDEVILITSARKTAGGTTVSIEAIDNFGFRDKVGFYTDDAPLTFPDSLGGGSFTDWDDADTAEKKQWVNENWGIYLDTNGYADELDPLASFRLNVYT